MMPGIITEYIGPSTDRRIPSGIKAAQIKARDDEDNSVTLSYDKSDLCVNDAWHHRRAARKLMNKMGWSGSIAQGTWKNGYLFTIRK